MIISTNHPTFTTSKEIEEIIKPIKQLGIVFFDYTRTDNDQGHVCLMTHPHVFEHYLDKKYYEIGNMEGQPSKYKSQILLMDTLPKQHIYDDLLRSRNIDHGLQIIKTNENSCEFFTFATTNENHSIANTYLNKIDIFTRFTMYFKDHAALLIKEAERKKIYYPFHDEELKIFYDDQQNYDINTFFQPIKLSKRQLQIAKELLNGKTAQEISKELNLSHRTVEYYLEIIKTKLNCKNKSELIFKLINLIK